MANDVSQPLIPRQPDFGAAAQHIAGLRTEIECFGNLPGVQKGNQIITILQQMQRDLQLVQRDLQQVQRDLQLVQRDLQQMHVEMNNGFARIETGLVDVYLLVVVTILKSCFSSANTKIRV
jgi:hypothetical protein